MAILHGITAVNWIVAQRIVVAWVLTIPAALAAFITYLVLNPSFGA